MASKGSWKAMRKASPSVDTWGATGGAEVGRQCLWAGFFWEACDAQIRPKTSPNRPTFTF